MVGTVTAMRIGVIQPSPRVPPGRLSRALEAVSAGVVVSRPDRGEPLPGEVDGLVVLGGEMGAYDTDLYPFLTDVGERMAAAVEVGQPVLGICLGSQLLADALGGRAFLADRPEVGLVDLEVTPAGRADPVLGRVAPPVLAVHQDTFSLPPDATLLARSDGYPHAFRAGSGLGIQFHPEADAARLEAWLRRPGSTMAERAGVDVDRLVAAVGEADARLEREAAGLFAAWLAEVSRSARSSAAPPG